MKEIKIYRQQYRGDKGPKGYVIHQVWIKIPSGQLVREILHERIGEVGFSQLCFYIPLPVCNGAVPEAEPDPQDQPGGHRDPGSNEVSPAGPGPDPGKKVKTDQCEVKDRIKYIECLEQVYSLAG